jgi:deoxyribodipyrimidine photolyase-related protein
MRNLVVVLGDQLDRGSDAYSGFDPRHDVVWMAEVSDEATQVWSHKARIALFLAAMRHLRDDLVARGWTLAYRSLEEHGAATLAQALVEDLAKLAPQRIVMLEAGEHRVAEAIAAAARSADITLEVRPDRHFLIGRTEFARWAGKRKALRMEHFYRWIRQRDGTLMEGKVPLGGRWNFDADNRGAFGKSGPGLLPAPQRFTPDAITQRVLDLVERRFPDHPGSLEHFDWPVTPDDAERALQDFVSHRLAAFGATQDAMWRGEPWLYHSRLAAAMNLKLLDPRRVIAAAEAALHDGLAPLPAVEGFVRQIIGWREFVRGVYWLRMPQFLEDNALEAGEPLPRFYWTGDTEMACLADSIGQTLEHGYAHHIQRLMVTGLFALLLGVRPTEVHAWYLAIYVDAVEWVELPNVLGMSQYADGGFMVSKPYCASGRYIQRMSNYCNGCRFDPALATGPRACPFTTLYWDFLDRHRERFARHPRTALQWKNLARLDASALAAIRDQAKALRAQLASA